MAKTSGKWAVGAVIAAIAGYIAGILTAPKSGKETRQDIKDGVEEGIAKAEKQLKKLHTQISDLLGEAKTRAESLKGAAQKDLKSAIENATGAKEKARLMLSALHENGADDKELKAAIDDANRAVEHLKAYLKK